MLDTLAAYGIEDIFCSPGSEWTPVWETLAERHALAKAAPRYWNCRHEALAACLGIGLHKASGRPSALLLHASIGPLNAAMALRSALHEQIPMIVLTGDVATLGEGDALRHRDFDPASRWLRHLSEIGGPARAAEPYVKWSGAATTPEALPSMLQHACRVALAPPQGPTVLAISFEALLTEEIPDRLIPRPAPAASGMVPDDSLLDAAAAMLAASRLPVVITEASGRDPANVQLLVELSESLSAPVVEAQSPGYLNFPRTHPHHAGFEWNDICDEADTLLLLALRGPWSPPSRHNATSANIIFADEDTTRTGLPAWGYSGDLTLTGNVGGILRGLTSRLGSLRAATPDESRPGEAAEHLARLADAREATGETRGYNASGVLNLDRVSTAISQRLPTPHVFVPETASVTRSILRSVPLDTPGSFLGRMTGGLGVGLGTALGVKMANPDALVVSLMGDGTLNYNAVLPALGFSQEYGLPILVVVNTNGEYASMKKDLLLRYPGGYADRNQETLGAPIAPVPDYASLAPMFGGEGLTVTDEESLTSGVDRAVRVVEEGRLAILDVRLP